MTLSVVDTHLGHLLAVAGQARVLAEALQDAYEQGDPWAMPALATAPIASWVEQLRALEANLKPLVFPNSK